MVPLVAQLVGSRYFAWLAVLGAVSCGSVVELPPVRTPLATDLGCPPAQYGVPKREVWFQLSDGSELLECGLEEFAACRPGRVDYKAIVDRQGSVAMLSVAGKAPVAVVQCVSAHLAEAVVTPAADCRDVPVDSTLVGDLEWGPETGLRGSHGGVLGAVWPCAPGAR